MDLLLSRCGRSSQVSRRKTHKIILFYLFLKYSVIIMNTKSYVLSVLKSNEMLKNILGDKLITLYNKIEENEEIGRAHV